MTDEIIWHDLECGRYTADLETWQALAADVDGAVLDLGAGTGRVTIPLARKGHSVVAVDVSTVFLSELARRAVGLPVRTVQADVRELALEEPFELVLAPMQTVQLLGGPPGRADLLARVKPLLAPGAMFAAALAEEVYPFDDVPTVPDILDHDGRRYASDAYAITQPDADSYVLHRRRSISHGDQPSVATTDETRLDRLTADEFEEEAADLGFTVLPRLDIAPTLDHVGSTVVMLGG